MTASHSISLLSHNVDAQVAQVATKMCHCKRKRYVLLGQNGFTLVEAVIVIVLTAIVATMVAVFIRVPVQGYVDTAARAELTDIADTSLRRMARDLRLALPNSIRVSPDGRYLEMLITKTGGRYLAEEDNAGTGSILSFDSTVNRTFTVVGPMPAETRAILAGDYVVVYNLGPGQAPADAYDCSGQCNRAVVETTPATADQSTLTMVSNPFAAQNPAMKSPSRRFQIVTTPVTYFCNGIANGGPGTLTRYWDYQIQKDQPVTSAALQTAASSPSPTTPRNALLATNVQRCEFAYNVLANVHSGLIGITLDLEIPNTNSGKVTLFQQVHVDNTP